MGNPIFTIGHSDHTAEQFWNLLQRYHVDLLVDVRTAPYSRRFPQFNKPELRQQARHFEIEYVHLPNAFGARRAEPHLLNAEGQVDFDSVRQTDAFRNGIAHLKRGVQLGNKIALMCAEEDPLHCHRFSMVSYQLVKEHVDVKHIRGNGRLMDNREVEQRMWVEVARYLQRDMFGGEDGLSRQAVEACYKLLEREVAFKVGEEGREKQWSEE